MLSSGYIVQKPSAKITVKENKMEMQVLSGPQINFQSPDLDVYVVARIVGDIVPERNNLHLGDILPVKISKSGTIEIPRVGSVTRVSFVSINNNRLEYFR